MEIRINTAESGVDELTALIALCASLGGRLPSAISTTVGQINVSATGASAEKIAAEMRGEIGKRENILATGAELVSSDGGQDEGGPSDNQTDAPEPPAVDSKGTPWDARIHSESRATVADGSWRKRRGVDDATFAAVMAELRAACLDEMTYDEDEAPPPPPAEDDVPLAPADVPAPPAPTVETPSAPEPAASAPAAGNGQFADFGAFVGAVSKHGKTYAELNEMAGVLGVPMFKDMKDHADKWDMFFGMIG